MAYAGLIHELFVANSILIVCPTFVLSRSLSALCAVNMPNARKAGMLCAYTKNTEKHTATIALVLILIVSGAASVLLSPIVGGITVIFAIASAFLYHKLTMKQFGGVTGDTSGFFLQICELTCLAGAWIGVQLI